jgi:pyridinium-3,5-bisthiocarboxylic acid mononucleotide nickel chelatase
MTPPDGGVHAWVDATAGVAGDMLLAALIDAGAPPETVVNAVNAVTPEPVDLVANVVSRAGLRATKIDVASVAQDQPDRSWADIQTLLARADLPDLIREHARRVFLRLAEAEGRVHGIPAAEVHFHEVGGWDSIADVVGVCAALDVLNVTSMSCSAIALGAGRAASRHGALPVPVPAVLELASGWRVLSGGEGELATPTGVALLTAISTESSDLPPMTVHAVGIGAGSRDVRGRPNVVRVVLGVRQDLSSDSGAESILSILESNVDDLDPRVWPSVLATLLDAGAADAWLVPIVMKKGRPAHTLAVLTSADTRDGLRRLMFELTSTTGIREVSVHRTALARTFVPVAVMDGQVRIKVAYLGGEIIHATPEFEDAAAIAAARAVPVRRVLEEAIAAAAQAGLMAGP